MLMGMLAETALTDMRMTTDARQALEKAITAALAIEPAGDGHVPTTLPATATALEEACTTATTSQATFTLLATAIDEAQKELEQSATQDKTAYQQAIDEAQAVYDNEATTNEQAQATIETLKKAAFEFRIANGSGEGPQVTTDPRFIRGGVWAFGRSTVRGGNIMEQGFCWAEHPDPKVTDQRTTEHLNQQGVIYWLRDLKPATVYYMRAYAINNEYGGGDEETNSRINYAINTAIDYYWNSLTSIHDFGISVSYSPGTPTADCSYGGSMRVGASTSYQQVGTIMHEALHGIGVGTQGMWWNQDIRPNGVWAGDRVTEALRFWDNNTTGVLSVPSAGPVRTGAVYDLSGRRVDSPRLARGLYITNGRKVWVK